MIGQHTLLVGRSMIMLKNYLMQNKTMLVKTVFFFLIFSNMFVSQSYGAYTTGKSSIASLMTFLMFIMISVAYRPLYFSDKQDYISLPDTAGYLKKIMVNNLIFWPLLITALISVPVLSFFSEKQLAFLMTIHAMAVWWFAGNFLYSLLKIKATTLIRQSTILIISIPIFSTWFIFGSEIVIQQVTPAHIKFIPILGCLFEIMSGRTESMFFSYFGFLGTLTLYITYVYRKIVYNSKPSAIREGLLNVFEEQRKLKEEKNILRKMFPFLIPKDKETKTSGKYAAALHYRNLCLNSKNKLLGYLDTNSLLIGSIILVIGWMNYNMASNRDLHFARIMALIQGNIMVWIYLLARKEKSVQADIYFAMIPAVPQQKLNQSLRYGLISVTVPALLANLLLVLILGCNTVLAIITGLTAPMLYLFKSASIFSLSMFLKLSPKSGYFNFMQSGLNILVGLFIPSIIITILMFGLTIVESFVTVMSTANRISVAQINVGIFLTLFLCYHLSIYGLFYAFFDKIYRKIDFGKN